MIDIFGNTQAFNCVAASASGASFVSFVHTVLLVESIFFMVTPFYWTLYIQLKCLIGQIVTDFFMQRIPIVYVLYIFIQC